MGCDGGTIPRRDELVRTKKKAEQKDKVADLAAKWKHCAISQDPLREPIMACELGRIRVNIGIGAKKKILVGEVSKVHHSLDVKSLPNDKATEFPKWKAFAHDKLDVAKTMGFFSERLENIMGKGEN